MQHLEHQEEEPILSEAAKRQKRVNDFKQYLVNSGCVLHLLKFLLGVRKKQAADDSVPSEDVLQMFKDYVGAVEVDTTEHDNLKKEIEGERAEGQKLRSEIEEIQKQIEGAKLEKARAEQQKRLREEQEAAKANKKGGKK